MHRPSPPCRLVFFLVTFSVQFLFSTSEIYSRIHPQPYAFRSQIERFYPEGNGVFVLYYGGSIKSGTTPTQETLDTMKRLWELQPNFVVVAPEFQSSREITEIFHRTDANHKPVKVLAYVILTDEPCQKLRSDESVDNESRRAVNTGYDGIFFDCARQDPENYPNIHEWNAARVAEVKKNGNKLVIMNPGEAYVDSRMFDYGDIVSVENQYDKQPTAFVRQKGVTPKHSEKVPVPRWRWLAVQGHPANNAAKSADQALKRMEKFRDNGGFWYYSPAYKKGEDESTHTSLPKWLENFATRAKQMEMCPCNKQVKMAPVAIKQSFPRIKAP
jgi:hypothetical protein